MALVEKNPNIRPQLLNISDTVTIDRHKMTSVNKALKIIPAYLKKLRSISCINFDLLNAFLAENN